MIRHAPALFARWCEPDSAELGELGEELAARHLRAQGWELLGRRLRTSAGEVDLLARERGQLVCVEVKTSRAVPVPRPRGVDPALARTNDQPGERWRPAQAGRLARAARLVAREHGAADARVDLVEVVLEPHRARVELRHRRG
ncbi:MAG: YraN family protein [Planctomycetes bacterium]|nr:YraN family protein [Planctomycetota bacterium]